MNRGFIQIALVVGIVVLLGIVGYLYFGKGKLAQNSDVRPLPSAYTQSYDSGSQNISEIKDTNDLKSAAGSLNSADTTKIDSELNALDGDSSGF